MILHKGHLLRAQFTDRLGITDNAENAVSLELLHRGILYTMYTFTVVFPSGTNPEFRTKVSPPGLSFTEIVMDRDMLKISGSIKLKNYVKPQP